MTRRTMSTGGFDKGDDLLFRYIARLLLLGIPQSCIFAIGYDSDQKL